MSWNVELDLRNIKLAMGMETLHCQTPDMNEKDASGDGCRRWHSGLLAVVEEFGLIRRAFSNTPTSQVMGSGKNRLGLDFDGGVGIQQSRHLHQGHRGEVLAQRFHPRFADRRPALVEVGYPRDVDA